jgi:hypothetical protein
LTPKPQTFAWNCIVKKITPVNWVFTRHRSNPIVDGWVKLFLDPPFERKTSFLVWSGAQNHSSMIKSSWGLHRIRITLSSRDVGAPPDSQGWSGDVLHIERFSWSWKKHTPFCHFCLVFCREKKKCHITYHVPSGTWHRSRFVRRWNGPRRAFSSSPWMGTGGILELE